MHYINGMRVIVDSCIYDLEQLDYWLCAVWQAFRTATVNDGVKACNKRAVTKTCRTPKVTFANRKNTRDFVNKDSHWLAETSYWPMIILVIPTAPGLFWLGYKFRITEISRDISNQSTPLLWRHTEPSTNGSVLRTSCLSNCLLL